jgi:cellulose synthase/poly-beta-1,6-N-acetylglucosamine synthase-like glycosyltransferase
MSDDSYRYGGHRFWEMLQGLLFWGTLVLSVVLSFAAPLWVIVFIIVFDLFWLFRVVYFVIHLFSGWREYKKTTAVDWEAKLVELDALEVALNPKRIHHLVFLPTFKEEIDIIRGTLRSIRDSRFPNDRVIIVLAGEERDASRFRKNVELIRREFGNVFKKIIVTEHPMNLPDEIPGKGSNLHFAGVRTAEILAAECPEIADEDIVVSSFDVDTVVHPQYFAYLTYLYCTVPEPTRTSYQPVALFANNIWTTPAPVRIAAFGTTFWILTELARPERLWTFSSHSMPWVMLKDVGFWQKDIVTEDSRIFMQALIRYDGNYRVTPMFLPVSMDTVTGATYLKALVALYRQMRRWAWGVEHLPYMIDQFRRHPQIPTRLKLKYVFNHIEGMYTWASAPLFIFILGWLPLRLASGESYALVQAAPFTLEWLMRLAMVGVFVSGGLSLTLLPPRPKSVGKHAWVVMLFQWALLPVSFIIFGALPAIDAQTRLMFGKYLGFNVTAKKR